MMRLLKVAKTITILALALSCLMAAPAFAETLRSSESAVVDQIVLNVAPEQIVGHPLRSPARALLLDETGGLTDTYNLAADPLTLSVSAGGLSPSIVTDTTMFAAGVVNLLPLNIKYQGPSGSVLMTASNASVSSSGLRVSFSGYDILEAHDLLGQPLERVYGNLPTSVLVSCTNGGDLIAKTRPSLKCFFKSGGGSVKVFFDPTADGVVNNLAIALPTSGIAPGEDTLVFVLDAVYQVSAVDYAVSDTMRAPVEVLTPASLELVAGSVQPDSVYPGVNFGLSFDVATRDFFGPISSTQLNAYLLSSDDAVVATVFTGTVETPALDADTIHYHDLVSLVPSAAGLEPGWYRFQFSYRLYSNGSVFSLEESGFDSLYIVPHADISFDDGSLLPEAVAAGQEARFQFDLTLDAPSAVEINDTLSLFRVFGNNFSSAANLVLSTSRLEPGFNRVTSGPIFVPLDQLGGDLSASATVVFRQAGAGNSLTATTTFGGSTVHVKELPLVQIISVSIVAPNAPNVNTDQSFQVRCLIANHSESPMESAFDLQMVSDGESTFDPILTVDYIPPTDTAEFIYDVTAAGTPSAAELFRVDIATVGVNELAPVDNIAIATIQTPANLAVGLVLRGAEGGYVNIGDDFDLIIVLINYGQGQVTTGRYRVYTNGVDLGLPGGVFEVEGTMAAGSVQGVTFQAPDFDTTAVISFRVIDRPVDLNTGLPAPINETEVDLSLAVTSLDVALSVAVAPGVTNVVYPGETKDLLNLIVTNPGTSSITDVRLESLEFHFEDRSGQPLDVRSLLEIGNTNLYDGSRHVAFATAGGDQLMMNFDNYVVEAGESRTLTLRTRVKTDIDAEFTVQAAPSDLKAVFASGPLSGLPVEVTPSEGTDLVDQVFSSFATGFSQSLAVRNNPFDPQKEEAEIRYYLDRDEDVRFRVFTLTGQLVYEKDFAAGTAGANLGENSIFWDGRNGEGHAVLNGVYVVYLEAVTSGRQATLKIAVLK